MIVEVTGRVFHMHIPVETELGQEELVADVAMESSMGLLMVSAGGVATTGSWPHREQWGVKTFEEFLCSKRPSWIVSKMLGEDAMIFDEERTREALMDICAPDHIDEINEYISYIDSHGELREGGLEASDTMDDILKESVDEYIFMQTTGFADFLIEGVLPALLERLAPEPPKPNLKLC